MTSYTNAAPRSWLLVVDLDLSTASGLIGHGAAPRRCSALVYQLDGSRHAVSLRYEERRVDLNQATLEEARQYGMMVPIVVWPDGRVEQGFEGSLGCFI